MSGKTNGFAKGMFFALAEMLEVQWSNTFDALARKLQFRLKF